ncbi:MAG: glycosyltransferase family 2 protein [Candidatus Lokiarchaeota archaeon]|nr:glycosyltransferase family 2 protein [Candidatus Lokiarchaeota archaeon]
MDLISWTLRLFKYFLNFISSIQIILLTIFLIILYHTLFFLLVDSRSIKAFKKDIDPDSISIDELKSIPLVNIIVPAWKEGKVFRECLLSIKNLSYPKIRVIVNAGGNDETIDIANSFKEYENFLILRQKGGKSRPSLGKVKAINECLSYIEEGLVYFIDADALITDEILLRVIYPLVNLNKDVVAAGRRPLKSKEDNDLTKYLIINRAGFLRFKFSREDFEVISGSNTIVKFKVIEAIERFSENKKFATDRSMASDIRDKGFKIYVLKDYRANMYDAGLPYNFKMFKHQRIVWITNFLIYSHKSKKIANILKFLLLIFVSLYVIIFPILLFLNFSLFLIGIYFLTWIYFKKMRRVIFHKLIMDKRFYKRLNFRFFIKIIYFIYMEFFINIILVFDLMKYLRKLRNSKNFMLL